MLLNSWLLTLPLLITSRCSDLPSRRYLKRAPKGYITEGGTYSADQHHAHRDRRGRSHRGGSWAGGRPGRARSTTDIAVSAQAERYTMSLRNILFARVRALPRHPARVGADARRASATRRAGHAGPDHRRDAVRPAARRAARPADRERRPAAGRHRLDVAGCSVSRPCRRTGGRVASGRSATALVGSRSALRVPRRSTTCCTASTWTCGPGSGWRSSDRAARASPRWVGCWPGSTRPVPDRSPSGLCRVTALPLDVLRTEVALVTQEHHVFVGTRPGQHHPGPRVGRRRRRTDGARGRRCLGTGSIDCRGGLDTMLGGGHLTPDPGPGAADRPGPAGGRRPAHPGAGRGDLVDRSADGSASGGLDGGLAGRTGRSSRSPIGCTPRTTRTGSRC